MHDVLHYDISSSKSSSTAKSLLYLLLNVSKCYVMISISLTAGIFFGYAKHFINENSDSVAQMPKSFLLHSAL